MKKLLTGIAVFITMAVLCISSAGAETYNGFQYSVLSDGTVSITGYTGGSSVIEIPSEIDGKKITAIADNAFTGQRSIVSVTMPDTITTIGSYAFNCCETLESVSLSDSLVSIGERAFNECISLKSIYIPYNVSTIGDYAFNFCERLTSAVLPDSLTSVGAYTFYECAALGYIRIPNNVTSIGNYAFYMCESMDYAILSEKLTTIGENAFYGCSFLDEMEIPGTVKSIGKYAFAMCSLLDTVTIEDGVTSIGEGAFYMCPKLTAVTVPDSVTTIDKYALGYYFDFDAYAPTPYDYFVITCSNGSAAHTYAVESGVKYNLAASDISGLTMDLALSARGYNTITLKWNGMSAASGYIIQQYKNGAWANITNIKDNTVTSYAVPGLAANTSYKFRAVAYTTSGDKKTFSKYSSALTISTAPAQTQGFAITGRGSDFLTISWTKNAGATGYIIQEQQYGLWKNVVNIKNASTTSYKITGLQPNSFHRYRMVAYKTDGNGTTYGKYTGSAPGYTAPAMVTGFTGVASTDGSATLTWNKVDSAKGYIIDIYRDGSWNQLVKLNLNTTTTYKATGLKDGVLYKFRIKSYATNGTLTINSTYSSAIAVTGSDFSVANLTMTNRGTDFISVKWDKNDKAEGYMVYIYDGSSWKCVKTLTSNTAVSHKITGLTSSKDYKVTVKAYKTVNGARQVSGATPISVTTL